MPGELELLRNEAVGRLYRLDDEGMPVAEPELMREILLQGRRRAGVPARYLRVEFKDLISQTVKQRKYFDLAADYARRLNEGQTVPGMVICGLPGTGKTMLVCAMINYLRDMGMECRYVNLISIFDQVKDAYISREVGGLDRVVRDLVEPRLLVIDEVGVHHGSNDERTVIYRIINGRWDNERPTILAGNLNREEMSLYMGEHILDRVLAGKGPFMVFDWESRR